MVYVDISGIRIKDVERVLAYVSEPDYAPFLDTCSIISKLSYIRNLAMLFNANYSGSSKSDRMRYERDVMLLECVLEHLKRKETTLTYHAFIEYAASAKGNDSVTVSVLWEF